MNQLSDAALIALSYLRAPYLFGSKDPIKGIDCSGMVELVLRKLNILPKDKGHFNSQMIFEYLSKNANFMSYGIPSQDCILFFRESDGNIHHIALAINERLMIEATGLNDICEINRIDRLKTLAECIKIIY
jgi:cell wall-associated NlpC family hydrolase